MLSSELSSLSLVPIQNMYFKDPWNLSFLINSDEDPRTNDMDILLFVEDISYQANLDLVIDPSPSSLRTEDEDIFSCMLG